MSIINDILNLKNSGRAGLPVRMAAFLLLVMLTSPVAFKDVPMKRIPLTQGKSALVDDEDFDHVNQWKWCARKSHNSYYAIRTAYLGGGRKNQKIKTVYLHRLIIGAKRGEEIDHRNGDSLDNQKNNLRRCTHAQNMQNMKRQIGKTSEHKGVSWYKPTQKWIAKIVHGGEQIHLGYFVAESDAAKAYNEAAKKYFGEFALKV